MLSRFSTRYTEEFACDIDNDSRYEKTPMLILNPEKTNFYDMTIDDFIMENYNPIRPQLKLELGI